MTDEPAAVTPTGPTDTPQTIRFGGYVKGANINARDGEWQMTIAVPPEHKYDALPATDHLGTVYDFELTPRVFEPEDFDPDVDVDGEPTREPRGQHFHA